MNLEIFPFHNFLISNSFLNIEWVSSAWVVAVCWLSNSRLTCSGRLLCVLLPLSHSFSHHLSSPFLPLSRILFISPFPTLSPFAFLFYLFTFRLMTKPNHRQLKAPLRHFCLSLSLRSSHFTPVFPLSFLVFLPPFLST